MQQSTNRFRCALPLLVALLLPACSVLDMQGNSEDVLTSAQSVKKGFLQTQAVQESAPEQTSDDTPFVLPLVPPDPYLSNARAIDEAAQKLFADADAAMRKRQWNKAREINVQLIQTYPALSGAYVNLGIISEHEKDHAAAEKYFKVAVNVNPNNYFAYNHLGILYRQQGRFEEAAGAYKRSVEVWPGYRDAHLNLGILYELYMGKLEEALYCYEYYQSLLAAAGAPPDKQLKGWKIDLKRRIKSEVQEQ